MTSVDTIFAVATPPGRSAIAVIRISGPKAGLSPALFAANCPAAGQFCLARLRAGDQIIDEANNLNCKIITTEKDYFRIDNKNINQIKFLISELEILEEDKMIENLLKDEKH